MRRLVICAIASIFISITTAKADPADGYCGPLSGPDDPDCTDTSVPLDGWGLGLLAGSCVVFSLKAFKKGERAEMAP